MKFTASQSPDTRSLLITLPPEIVELAGFKQGDEVILKTAQGMIIITKVDEKKTSPLEQGIDWLDYQNRKEEPTREDLNLLDQITDPEE